MKICSTNLWGCDETCPFCNEPCVKQSNHHGSSHICKQHRPQCCRGIFNAKTRVASLSVCNYSIQSEGSYYCSVINRKCNCSTETLHLYKEFKIFNPQWDICPSLNMDDTS